MEPKKVGRALGIGVRVASKMVQQRILDASQAPTPQIPAEPPRNSPSFPQRDRAAATLDGFSRVKHSLQGTRLSAVNRGLRALWDAFVGPFTHAGSILWLEITGLFFALFTFFFAQSVYRARGSWRAGPDHLHLILYVALAAAFAWFSASSFLRARRKSRRGRAQR